MRLILACALAFFLFGAVGCSAQTTAPLAYHIETAPAKHIRATLTDTWETPGITPNQWAFFIPFAPSSSWQSFVGTSLSVDGLPCAQGLTTELSPLQRPLLWLRVSVPGHYGRRAVTAHVMYDAVLYSRHLVAGPPATPVPALSGSDFRLNTRASETIDFGAVAFQQWLWGNGLKRLTLERDLDFAFRVYQKIRKLYHYNYDPAQSRKASLLCQTNATDCGGLSDLFVAALRANSIPSRILGGRMAQSATKPSDYGQCHVRSEFFADGIGWTPVDMSFGVGASDKNALAFFGNDPGDFLTMYKDLDFVLSPGRLGPKNQIGFQQLSHWIWGDGDLSKSKDNETWQVEELPVKAS